MEQILLREKIQIPKVPEGSGDDGNGVHSFIYRGEQVREIEKLYGRENCCLKIFKNNEPFREQGWWGHSSRAKGSLLTEATCIQNIYAMEGLAPRVYALLILKINGKKHWAHLTDDLGHCIPMEQERNKLFEGKIREIAEKYGFEVFDDGREWNMVADKYVDFQGFHFKEDYKERLKQRLIGVANVGKWGPWMNYHNIPELGITGGRKNEQRIKDMHLDEIDFKGKTVLDIGCSEGFFCRYAIDRGARKVTGIDLEGVVRPVEELTYFLGYNNVDYLGYDLNREIPDIEKYDIVFFFSMVQHIGLPDWVSNRTRELLIFEGNGKDRDIEGWSKLNNSFSNVEEVGKTHDLFERIVLWAKK
jgi:2-polyprenyl-3-methyl-5-hydroxy-6-metoxy-1,4-benzoquinol methylase